MVGASFFGCSAQSQSPTNAAQTKPTNSSPTPSPIPVKTEVSNTPRDTFPFEVKGVAIGTSYQTVLSQLGKPLSNRKRGTNPCGGTKQVLRYSGLTVTLDEGEDKQNIVVIIEVTSPKWEIASGISVDASLEDVQTKFGQPDDTATKSGSETLTYFDGDGAVTFFFRNKKLVKVNRDLNLC